MELVSPRDRTVNALRRRNCGRMPLTLDVGAAPGIGDMYLEVFRRNAESAEYRGEGGGDPADYFDYDIRIVDAPLSATASNFSGYHRFIPPGTRFDEFGVGHVFSEAFPLGRELHPWELFDTPEHIEKYPFPGFELREMTRDTVADLHRRGYAVSAAAGSINEWCYYLRGMERFMIDLMLEPRMARAMLDRVTGLCTVMGTALARAGVDVLCFYGDMGSQHSLLMGLDTWRQWILPRWKDIIGAVRRVTPEALIFYHSCGYIEPLIPGLIEAGFDILNPVQPESMDPSRIKRMYGGQIALWGGIGMQSAMLGKSPSEVRQVVRRLADEWCDGGGGIVTVAQTILPDVPWENVLSLVNTIRE